MNKLIITIMLAMLLVAPLVSAAQDSLGTYKQGEDITLLQICGTCTYNNITSIVYPNSTHLIIDTQMTKRGMEYNYTFTEADLIGTYLVNGFGDLDGTDTAWAYELDVTGTGAVFGTTQMIFYAVVMIILAFLFVITLFGFNILPNEDPKDLDGKLMDINWLKYLRYPMAVLAWGELTMMFFLGWNIAEGYFATSLAAKIFEIFYKINFYGLMIALPIMLWYIVVKAMEDKKWKAMIERGIM